jgi:cytochrome c biogenesis protein CcmG, thiol:disulfide interchange protein DsbE
VIGPPEEGRQGSVQMPQFPLRPGRPAFSKRARFWVAVGLLSALLVAAVVGAILAHSSSPRGHFVTIPKADRNASPTLIRAAEAVGFHPLTTSGAGQIEDEPAAAANPPLTGDLLPVGSTAPVFTARTPTGKVVRLSDLRGKAVLLDFFATWCPHCAAESPHLQKLFASLDPKHVAFVAVDANGEDAPSVFAYHVFYGFGFPAVLDPSGHAVSFPKHGHMGPISKSYKIAEYPTFYVLDPSGRVVWRSDGEQPDALLRHELQLAAAKT